MTQNVGTKSAFTSIFFELGITTMKGMKCESGKVMKTKTVIEIITKKLST